MGIRTSLRTRHVAALAPATLFFVAVLAVESRAQTIDDWQRGTVLAGSVGGAVASPDTRLFTGTALGWEIMPRLSVEGRAAWLPHADQPTDFVALLNAAVPLLPGRRTVPFVSGGIGMYRATIDPGRSDVPEFYARRLGAGTSRRVFQDRLISFGGGVDLFATRHLAIRPDVSVWAVMGDGERRWMPVYTVSLAYHFEAHGIREHTRP